MKKRLALFTFLVVMVGLCPSVEAIPAINFGNHPLLPNTPGQQIMLFVTGGDSVAGMELRLQMGDGGAFAGGTDLPGVDFPAFTGMDLLTGTIFAAGTQTPVGVSQPLIWGENVSVLNNVAASGKIATVTFNTTGLFAGTYPVSLTWNVPVGTEPTRFAGIPADLTDGTVFIVPEPLVYSMIVVGIAGLALQRRLLCRPVR